MRMVAFAGLVACATPTDPDERGRAPEVTAFSPETAEYGAVMTIEGRGFGASRDEGALLLFTRPGDTEPTPYTPWRYQVKAWTDEKIQLQIAFPMAGTIWIENEHGRTEAGTFTPASWDPNIGTTPGAWSILDAVALDEDRVAAVMGHALDVQQGNPSEPRLVIFGPGTVEEHVLAPEGAAIRDVDLVVTASGTLEALIARDDGLVYATWSGGAPVTTALAKVDVIGHDATGLHAWNQEPDGLYRARPPDWTFTKVIAGDASWPPLVASGGGALFFAEQVRKPGTAKGEHFYLYRLREGEPAPVRLHSGYGEAGVSATSFAAAEDDDSLTYRYCYTTYDLVIGTTTRCYQVVRASGDQWGYTQEGVTYRPGPSKGFVAHSVADRLPVISEPRGGYLVNPIELSLFAISRHRAVYTPSGALRVLVMPEALEPARVYLPRRR